MAFYVLVVWMMQAQMQYLYIGAVMVFGIMQQYDFSCIWVLGDYNLEMLRLTGDLKADRYLHPFENPMQQAAC